LIQALWDSSAEAERRVLASYVPGLDPNPSNVRVFNLVDLDPVFGDLLAHPTTTEIVANYLGEDYLMSNCSALHREVKHRMSPDMRYRLGLDFSQNRQNNDQLMEQVTET
jgi:hypothetical protein